MSDALFRVPTPVNEPVRAYAPGDASRATLKEALKTIASQRIEIPCVIGGKDVRTGIKRQVVMPHSHREVLADFHLAGKEELDQAVEAARKAKPAWAAMSWENRAAIFLKAADLIAGPYRDIINASTMLGQSKSVFQAEIDAACEFTDFLRFNAHFYQEILQSQPLSSPGIWNRLDHRPLDGFVAAITPFNFTAIAGNLPSAPALTGNTVVWKPSDTQMLSAYYTMKIFREAGLPDGVINMVPADGPLAGDVLLSMKDLGGVHFTGSTATFKHIWKTVGLNIERYENYPRLVGETGGKDFVFAHPSADVEALTAALVRGAYEYQGQKCSAASRAYIPQSLWKNLQERMVSEITSIRMGDVRDFRCFMNAVIDERAHKKIAGYLDYARTSSDAKILAGGKYNAEKGYFVDPTLIQALKPDFKTMVEEIFGPVLTVFVYEDKKLEETLDICDRGTPYALTGAIFSQDRYAADHMATRLRGAAGNLYLNDKPTGAVVGQQPFGGGRASGTNDKAGSQLNLLRWISPRTIKEALVSPKSYAYPFMGAE